MSDQDNDFFTKMMMDYTDHNPDEAMEQIGRILNLRELDSMKLSLTLEKKTNEVQVLQKALDSEQKTNQHLIECLNKSEDHTKRLMNLYSSAIEECKKLGKKNAELLDEREVLLKEIQDLKWKHT